jgi:hypothetical protein
MSEQRLRELGIPRRGFLKRAGTIAFVAPVVVSFGLDGIAEGQNSPRVLNPNQCYPNQVTCPHYGKKITGTHLGPLKITAGQSVLLSGATIDGPVTVEAGGGIGVEKSFINGALKANGATSVIMHNSVLHGRLTVTASTHFVSIGGTDPCASGNNEFYGPVTITGNHGVGTYFQDNVVYGPLTVTSNTNPVGDLGNTVYGQRSLQSNVC